MHAALLPASFGIHMLNIEKYQIHIFQNSSHMFPFAIACGVESCMKPLLFACFEQLQDPLPLLQRLASGNGYAPTCIAIKWHIASSHFENLFHPHVTPHHFNRMRRTHLGAFQTIDTQLPIYRTSTVRGRDGINRTSLSAFPASYALTVICHNFAKGTNSLGITAPGTLQRAALHKNGSPDSRAILDGELLHVEYETLEFVCHRLLWDDVFG
jgi:hypothetical protein